MGVYTKNKNRRLKRLVILSNKEKKGTKNMIERIKIIVVINESLEEHINNYIQNNLAVNEVVRGIKFFKEKNELEPKTAVLLIGDKIV